MSSAATTTLTLARRCQAWLRSRPRVVDVFFAGLMAMLALADLAGGSAAEGTRDADMLGVILILIAAGALVWRRSASIQVMAIVVGISCVFYARDYGSFMAAVGLASFYAVTVYEKRRRIAWTSLAVSYLVLISAASFSLLQGADGFGWSNGLSMTLSIGVTILAGAVIRNKEEIFIDTKARAERAEADREAEAERAVDRERLRIAREMHDVVAHGMSLITVQAAAAHEVALTRPADAARLMRSVETTGRDALAEMRRMLGVLRNDEQSDATTSRSALAPQPSLADLGSIVAHCVEAGTPTELTIGGSQRPLAAGVELAAFRIVQEALTNVVKHGGDAARATVKLHYESDVLRITVSDTGRGAASDPNAHGVGHGLIGMRERVDIYNGQITAGPKPGGGYRVEVSLPIKAMTDQATTSATELKGPDPKDPGPKEQGPKSTVQA